MDVRNAASQLAKAVLEAEDSAPRKFLKKHAPRVAAYHRTGKIPQEHEWELIGIQNSDYFQGRGTAFTNWDEVYVGAGDTPAEAADNALEQAAEGWNLESVEEITDDTPSAYEEVKSQVRQEADIDRDDYESEEDYVAAVDEWVDEQLEMGDFNLYFYVALYLREYNPELD